LSNLPYAAAVWGWGDMPQVVERVESPSGIFALRFLVRPMRVNDVKEFEPEESVNTMHRHGERVDENRAAPDENHCAAEADAESGTGQGTEDKPAESGTTALRRQLLRLLRYGRPTTTAELRRRIRESGFDCTQAESVYRNLLILRRHGLVKRVEVRGRHAYWVIAESG